MGGKATGQHAGARRLKGRKGGILAAGTAAESTEEFDSERVDARKPGEEFGTRLLRQAAKHLVASVDMEVEPEVPESLGELGAGVEDRREEGLRVRVQRLLRSVEALQELQQLESMLKNRV